MNGGECMGRKIICPECNTIFDEDVLKAKKSENTCLVCGADLGGTNSEVKKDDHSDWITWYYYGFLDKKGRKTGNTTLETKPIDLSKRGDRYYLIQEFKAPPKDAKGNEESELTKEELRKYVPGAFIYPPKPQIMCPSCFSTEFQLVPKRFSILTGFATNQYDRVCNRCGRKF